jgi:hypothetical protein
VEQITTDLEGLMPPDPYARGRSRFVTVIDTDALLSSLDNHLRTNRPSLIARLARSGRVELLAANHVFAEVYNGFRKINSNSAERLRLLFDEQYLPYIRWVEVDSTTTHEDARVEATSVVDATDKPTALLASLVGPCLVLSGDRSLRRPGFAPAEWRPAAGSALTMLTAEDRSEGAVGAVGLPIAGVVVGSVKLGNRIGVPWVFSVALLAIGLFALLEEPSRRTRIWSKLGPFIEAVGDQIEVEQARARSGRAGLAAAMCKPTTAFDRKQQIAIVLGRATAPMLAAEIREEMLDHFAGDRVPTIAEIRTILRAGPEFTQPERYRWQLGRYSWPWRGAV